MSPIYSFIYGVPYCILLIVILCFARYDRREKTQKVAIYGIGAILVLFFGLRGFVQTDWQLYYWMFEDMPTLWTGQLAHEDRIEPGYMLYAQIFKSICPNYFAWIFFNTLVDVTILTWIFLRYSRSLAWSWAFFLAFAGLVIEMNLFRNCKAICIFLLALPYIQDRKFWKFFLLWLLSMSFHFSSVVFFPMYFILNKNWGKAWPLVLFVFVNVIFFFQAYPTSFILNNFLGSESVFIEKALNYMAMSKAEEGITFGYIERTLMFILVYFLYNKLIQQDKSNMMFCNSFYIFYTLWYVVSDVPVFVERFPILFAFAYWVLGPNMMALAKGQRRRMLNVGVILFLMTKVFMVTDHILYEYDNLTWGIKSYNERYTDIRRYQNTLRRK